MNLEEYIESLFVVIHDHPVMGKVIDWNTGVVYTNYEYFLVFFGEIIQKSLDGGWERDELMRQMVIESIKKNYGLVESIIN